MYRDMGFHYTGVIENTWSDIFKEEIKPVEVQKLGVNETYLPSLCQQLITAY